jgi:hypothetical protein
MPNPLLLDIVEYLVDNNVAVGDGIDCFRDYSPEDPDNVIVLYEYRGSTSVPFDDTTQRAVQVTVRSSDPDYARDKAIEIFNLFKVKECAKRVDFTTDRWGQVTLRNTPFKIKVDENDRFIYGFNMGVLTTIY